MFLTMFLTQVSLKPLGRRLHSHGKSWNIIKMSKYEQNCFFISTGAFDLK